MENILYSTSLRLKELKTSLPEILLHQQIEMQPPLKAKYGQRQIDLHLEDTRYHLSYLAESIAANEPLLFYEYLSWAKSFFANLPVTDEEIILNLELLRDELEKKLEPEQFKLAGTLINRGIRHYIDYNPDIPSFIKDDNPLAPLAKEYLYSLINGNKNPAHHLIMNAVEKGTPIKDIYLDVFQITQRETGRLWQISNISVAQEHYITAATQLIMSQLYPYLFTSANKQKKIVVSCTAGELHELGARMVADLFELDGWDSYYFGANTPESSLLSAIQSYKPDVVALSVTMTFNLDSLTQLIGKIKAGANTGDTKVLVGGYPFIISEKLWQHVGADGCGRDALEAIKLANQLTV